jgi:hypothetical protein
MEMRQIMEMMAEIREYLKTLLTKIDSDREEGKAGRNEGHTRRRLRRDEVLSRTSGGKPRRNTLRDGA